MTTESGAPYCYDYPRPALTVDVALVRGEREGQREILLIQRRHPPFEDHWALPGGFVEENEPLEIAALRELQEETALRDLQIRQIGAFGEPGRDPRGWVISVAFASHISNCNGDPQAGDDAAEAAWWPLHALPPLAFDHAKIVDTALRVLKLLPAVA